MDIVKTLLDASRCWTDKQWAILNQAPLVPLAPWRRCNDLMGVGSAWWRQGLR